MYTIFQIFTIAIIMVFITDISGFPDEIKGIISRWLTKGRVTKTDYRIHLLDCSMCQCFWLGNLFLLITGNFTLYYIMIVSLVSGLTVTIKNFISLIYNILDFIIIKLNSIIE